ncbi:MAG: IS4 family transposase [Ferruginibacter sp.]|nr:IS4 family transposase [Ferruginibacter sp.]
MLSSSFKNSFGDIRLDKRGNEFARSLLVRGTHSIRQISKSSSDQKANYRFLKNDRTTESAITTSISNRCAASVKGKVVLSIQDTSEINLYKHKNRIKKDGSTGTTNAPKNGLGFFIHPSLVVDAATCFPYGYCDVRMWNRSLVREKKTRKDKHTYKKLSIEQKESNKWQASSKAAKTILKEAETVIIVQDREGDIYEQFATIPDAQTHLLIRAKSDRTLPEGGKLFSKVSMCDVAGTYSIKIEGDKRKGQKKRTAQLEVRFTEVEIKNCSRTAKAAASTVKLWCVEARELSESGKQSICWRLLTSIPVTTLKEALMIIEWYSWRWLIEEVFRILKKEGFNIEASELESGKAIKKLCLLILDALIKIFQMHIAWNEPEEEGLPASICFTETEMECVDVQCKKMEGKTEKLKNPFIKSTLRYATWVIARLGGWKGYASERKPGITTLWIGLEKYYDTFNGWKLAIDVSTR